MGNVRESKENTPYKMFTGQPKLDRKLNKNTASSWRQLAGKEEK
jgi:hypothetical protein